MIIWFTGQPGSGKTTLANMFVDFNKNKCNITGLEFILIDGDEIRTVFNNKDYSEAGRIKNMEMVQNLCLFLEYKKFIPIVSLVSPYLKIREQLKNKAKVLEIYTHTDKIIGRENYFVNNYEPPINNYLDLNTGILSKEECLNEIRNVYRKMADLA